MTDIPKLRAPVYPEIVERGQLSSRQKEALKLAQDFRCAGCGIKPARWDWDHRLELWEGGTNELSNWQGFGSAKECRCHAIKTAAATKRRARMHRLRGDTGQIKRRKANGGTRIKGQKAIAKRPFQKPPPGFKHQWGKRK